jgi:hypothetical protein
MHQSFVYLDLNRPRCFGLPVSVPGTRKPLPHPELYEHRQKPLENVMPGAKPEPKAADKKEESKPDNK